MPKEKAEKVKKEPKLDPRYASKEDVNSIMEMLQKIAGAPNAGPVLPASVEDKIQQQSELPDASPIAPKYRMLVDEILGPDFGVNISYPDQGSGFLFRVIVPLSKSNATQAHLEFYKTDIRTKAIGYQEGVDGVRKFLEKVAANLKIKKQNR